MTKPTENFEFNALDGAKNYRRAIMREFSPHLRGNVIEVGAGIGQMTEYLRNSKSIKLLQCVEPNHEFCQKFLEKLPTQAIIEGMIESVPDKDWNAIVSVNVLEHIKDDEKELRSYRDLLKRNHGTLCLFVPARAEIYSNIDRGFGHYRRYDMRELKKKLIDAGFRIGYMRYFNFIGYFLWALNFRIMNKRSFNKKAVRFFDRFIFPVGHKLESILWNPPIGQSIIAVVRVH